ncbi:MAG: NAD(P)-binding domain-containing protein, partial [Candidatus Nitrosocosmicus sp.]
MSISNEDSSLESDQITNNNNSNNNNKVVVIGLGQLGLPVAKYVKEHGFDTYGYDINQKAMQSAET